MSDSRDGETLRPPISLSEPGQLLFAGFEGTGIPDDLAELIAAGRVGGAILFARNVRDPEQVRALVAALHAHAPENAPLTVCIDQEGGRVQRLRPPHWRQMPPARDYGDLYASDPEGAKRAAFAGAPSIRHRRQVKIRSPNSTYPAAVSPPPGTRSLSHLIPPNATKSQN